MIKHLNFKTTDDCKLFIYSDLHIGHTKDFILDPRGFKTALDAKETLIKNWNSKVTNNDTAFLLGDTVVGAGQDSEKVFREVLSRLNYKELYIMPGNHFAGLKQVFEKQICSSLIDDYYRLTFALDGGKFVSIIPNYYEIVVDKQFVVMSHYPVLSFRDASKEAIMIYGHCHNNLTKSPIGLEYLKGRVLDVGPESIGNYPISFSEIMKFMNTKNSLKVDHH